MSSEISRSDTFKKELKEYLAGRRKRFSVSIDIDKLSGTKFQKRVWKELTKIPYGMTITYGELAKRIGRPKACRAVGNACGKNPVSIIIPCHRVTGAGGRPGGFAGGPAMKKRLLKLEKDVKGDV